ncbi:hypothetical protein [Phaeacidiphilus oryzae]|uniref:hypothetical protein n=1 Tax=Phaeacidiphilus oryzae TaxID=348818 RepID=UPI0005679654|nr:hypothetical protein [Phaeacidiphilus oryzae]
MRITELRPALRTAGVDDAVYRLEGEPWNPAGPGPDHGGIALLRSRAGEWYVLGGADATYGTYSRLRTFGTEEEACEVFYREMTRPEPFAVEKVAWAAEFEARRAENRAHADRTWPEAARVREHWHRIWQRREAQDQPAMTAVELDQALREAGSRGGLRIGGIDPVNRDNCTLAAPCPDGRWWIAWSGERGGGGHYLAVGLTEAEACTFLFNSATAHGVADRPTSAQWRGQLEAARWNREQRPIPPSPWPDPGR